MKGFHFRLEPVLAVRKHREELVQSQLGESQRLLQSEIDLLELLYQETATQVEQLGREQQPGPLNLDSLCGKTEYLAVLERRLRDQGARVEAQAQRVAEDRERLVAAARERKALEKLREARLVAFAQEATRREHKVAEEIGTVRYVLRMQAEAAG